MKNLLYCTIALVLVSLGACTTTPTPTAVTPENSVTIGTFNIEWLGDGNNDLKYRTDAEIKMIADEIIKSGIEVLGLEEIENEAALSNLIKYLPEYNFIIDSPDGNQNVAVIFKNSIEVNKVGKFNELAVNPRTRPGLVVQCKKGNFDWEMMVVHLKSTSRYDSTAELRDESLRLRFQQTQVLTQWLDKKISEGKEQDLFIVGDFNDTPAKGKSCQIGELLNYPKAKFLTTDLTSCSNPKWKVIDHIVASQAALNRYSQGSAFVHNFYNTFDSKTADKISDHCPVSEVFDVSAPDND